MEKGPDISSRTTNTESSYLLWPKLLIIGNNPVRLDYIRFNS